MRRISLFAASIVAGMLSACGAPSSLDICHAICDANRRCGVISDANAANCHTACDNNRGSLADNDAKSERECTNSGDVRKRAYDCYSLDCNKITSCVTSLDTTCVKRN